MKDSRIGESLWTEWSGELLNYENDSKVTFFTIDHVELHDELVKRALASAVQRSGVADSLGQAFSMVESSNKIHGFAGCVGGDIDFTVCDEDGETFYGEWVDEIFPVTWVILNV